MTSYYSVPDTFGTSFELRAFFEIEVPVGQREA